LEYTEVGFIERELAGFDLIEAIKTPFTPTRSSEGFFSQAAQRGQVSPIRDVWKRTRTCSGAMSGEAAVAGELRGDVGFGAGHGAVGEMAGLSSR
jgi:hypothetical protein